MFLIGWSSQNAGRISRVFHETYFSIYIPFVEKRARRTYSEQGKVTSLVPSVHLLCSLLSLTKFVSGVLSTACESKT